MAETGDHRRGIALRRRNIALACIAAAAVVAAVIRVSLNSTPAPPATVARAGSAMPARPAPAGAADPIAAVEIRVHLALAPGIELPAATTVFLIVRSPDRGPMPLAVKRLTVADLPGDVTLADADVMVAARSLRDADVVELVARASVSGDVKAGPGDYEGKSGVTRVVDISQPITLIIDHAL